MGKSKKFVGKKSGTAEKKASREMTVAEAAELVSCDESGYDAQLAAKVARVRALLGEVAELPETTTVVPSPKSHFRQRSNFRVWHEPEATGLGVSFIMYSPSSSDKEPLRVGDFARGDAKTNALMGPVLAALKATPVLRDKLGPDVVVIGRSRRVQIAVGGAPGAQVEETLEIPCEPPLRLELVQLEGEFSQPNGAVLATELTKPNAAVARENAAKNGRSNVVVARLSAAEVAEALRRDREFARLKELGVDLDAYDLGTLFVDPPRCGLDAPALKLAPRQTVVYMSCGGHARGEPARAQRDARRRRLRRLRPVPYTDHCEANRLNYDRASRDTSKVFFDPLGLYPEDAEGQARMQLAELKNARTAMIGFAAVFVHHFMPAAVPGLGGLH
ncbi:S-adenosylmethionine-dependent tRNA (m5U54) methyltransferase [Aureococcus anophagefferens]|nr:S-adenosylmethionine-dependent tRNA (m5U54) methyltransferase [Aureococcus anophagefferens]